MAAGQQCGVALAGLLLDGTWPWLARGGPPWAGSGGSWGPASGCHAWVSQQVELPDGMTEKEEAEEDNVTDKEDTTVHDADGRK